MLARVHIESPLYAPVEAELDQVIANLQAVAAEEGGILSSDQTISARLAHVLAVPGKRVRPAITLFASTLWGGRANGNAITMATAVELLHIATLVHDDTVDRADRRRGQTTASKLWGNRVAVLLGDYLFAASARFVCDTHNIRVVRRFAETIMELSKGQLSEMLDSGKLLTDRDAYLERIYNKTASLFSTAAESGAVLSRAPEEDITRLRDFGYNVGMAYQIMDDVLDVAATSQKLGKPACNDLRQGILTLPSILLMERAPEDNPIRHLFASSPDDQEIYLKRAVEEIRASGILDECIEFANRHVRIARRAIEPIPESEARSSLLALAEFASTRSS